MEKFVVTYAPFTKSPNDINKMFAYTALMLLLPAVFGTIFFGFNAIFVVLTAVLVCFISEAFFNLLSKGKFKTDDISFLVTGLVLGVTMPVKMPLHIVAISAFIATFIIKMVFGGLGRNKFNPALVGRLFAGVLASGLATNLYEVNVNGEVLASLSEGGENLLFNLFTGKAVGGIGTTCIALIIVSYVFLVYMSVIDWKIPLFSVIAYFVTAYFVCGMEHAILNVCSGSFLFVSVFMLTDPNTSPNTFLGKFVYSVLFGALSAVLWNIGLMGEDTIFVVAMIVNVLVPFMDKYLIIKQKPLGGYRYAH